jgi:hypothetical protein
LARQDQRLSLANPYLFGPIADSHTFIFSYFFSYFFTFAPTVSTSNYKPFASCLTHEFCFFTIAHTMRSFSDHHASSEYESVFSLRFFHVPTIAKTNRLPDRDYPKAEFSTDGFVNDNHLLK